MDVNNVIIYIISYISSACARAGGGGAGRGIFAQSSINEPSVWVPANVCPVKGLRYPQGLDRTEFLGGGGGVPPGG